MSEKSKEELPTLYARDLETEAPEDRWLVRELWGRTAVGIVGGAAKSLKTWFGLDLAVSVASGTPALGHFEVEVRGPSLVYLAEDALAQVRTRLECLCHNRGLDIGALDLLVITSPVLRLDTGRDQARLRATLSRLRPKLLLLDPLVRLHRLDENSSLDISGLLGYFRELQRSFDLAVILVHHTGKKQRPQPGQTLRGSSDLHAFGDSNAYLARKREEITLTLEHRSAPSPKPMALELFSSGDGIDTHLKLRPQMSAEEEEPTLGKLVLKLLEKNSTPLTRTEVRANLRVNNQRLGEVLGALERSGEIHRRSSGWALSGKRKPRKHDAQRP